MSCTGDSTSPDRGAPRTPFRARAEPVRARLASAVERRSAGMLVLSVVIAPVIGGLIYGPLVARFAPEARGHGVPEVMLAVNRLGGRMRPQVPIVKSLASALCIGSGGSVGREEPIVQIGSALGSVIGQLVRVTESQLRLLVVCGAAAGFRRRSTRRSRACSSRLS